jgi:hypothetical protein
MISRCNRTFETRPDRGRPVSLIEHVRASLKLIESAIASEAALDNQYVTANVIVLDDVTPCYVKASAALKACDADLGEGLHFLLDSGASKRGRERLGRRHARSGGYSRLDCTKSSGFSCSDLVCAGASRVDDGVTSAAPVCGESLEPCERHSANARRFARASRGAVSGPSQLQEFLEETSREDEPEPPIRHPPHFHGSHPRCWGGPPPRHE